MNRIVQIASTYQLKETEGGHTADLVEGDVHHKVVDNTFDYLDLGTQKK